MEIKSTKPKRMTLEEFLSEYKKLREGGWETVFQGNGCLRLIPSSPPWSKKSRFPLTPISAVHCARTREIYFRNHALEAGRKIGLAPRIAGRLTDAADNMRTENAQRLRARLIEMFPPAKN